MDALTPGPDELAETWQVYVTKRCSCHREFLILHYRPLVVKFAAKFKKDRNFPQQVELDDLVSYGTFGLIKAVERYRPDNEKRTTFETVAMAHIRSTILDAIRALDWAPRSVRRKQRELDDATMHFERAHGRAPTLVEAADWLNSTPDEVGKRVELSEKSWARSLDERQFEEDDRYDYFVSDEAPDVSTVLVEKLFNTTFEKVFRSLPLHEQLVIALHYFESKSFEEIAKMLGVQEDGVEAMHTDAVCRFHARFVRVMTAEKDGWVPHSVLNAAS